MRFLPSSVAVFALLLPPTLAFAQASWEDSPGRSEGSEDATAADDADSASELATGATEDEPGAATPEEGSSKPQAPPPAKAEADEPAVVQADAVVVLKTEQPAPVEKTTRRVHDGFYLRGSIGHGWFGSKFTQGLLADGTIKGDGGAFDLQLGGTPSTGLVVGGGLFVNGMENDDVRPAGLAPYEYDGKGSVGLAAVGPFIDYFPDPKGGFHVGGTLGFAALGFETPSESGAEEYYTDEARVGTGGAVGAWVGYDWWVAREWSLGAQLRYLGVAVDNPDHDWEGAADTLTLQFTVLYH